MNPNLFLSLTTNPASLILREKGKEAKKNSESVYRRHVWDGPWQSIHRQIVPTKMSTVTIAILMKGVC